MDEEQNKKATVNTSATFAEQVDAVLSGADTSSTHLEVLKNTPPLLRMVGLPNLPIVMTAHHVKTMAQDTGTDLANYHGLGAELVKRIPELISDPVIIMDSLTKEDSVVIVTQTADKENRPIIGAVKIAGKAYSDGKRIEANILTSAYGKDNFSSFLARNIEADRVLYVSKEKSQELTNVPGLQLPDKIDSLDFNTIIRKSRAFVNSQDKKNSDNKHYRALPEGKNTKKKEQKMKITDRIKNFFGRKIESDYDQVRIEHKEKVMDSSTENNKHYHAFPEPSAQPESVETKSADGSASTQTSYRDTVILIRDQMVQTLIGYIEQNPTQWESGWNNLAGTAPENGKTGTAYRGINSLYLAFTSMSKGYKDPRWVTFNQAKELGASVKKGEKSVPIIFFELYDRATKKAYDGRTVKHMTDEEKTAYVKENVYAVMKYSSVFNAAQCHNFPERDVESLKMSEEERANQNELIDTIIINSAAPVKYDGGNRAYYSPDSDTIHVPPLEAFSSMQDYYATVLHEIAHSTGHSSRLNRDMSGGSESYAKEELRAELACVFMQLEQGLKIDGKHITNHAAYLNSWLKVAKDDPKIFYEAARDAEKISDYVAEHYLQSIDVDELELETDNVNQNEGEHKEKDVLSQSVKEWYQKAYPMDELGKVIPQSTTFKTLQEAVNQRGDVYSILAQDSTVRERAFTRLAELTNTTYDSVYKAWSGESLEDKIEREMTVAREDYPNDFEDDFTESLLDHFESKQNAQVTEKITGERKEEVEKALPNEQRNVAPPLVINLFAGPGAGKTTAALELTAALKKEGYNVEYVAEYAKELVLENKLDVLNNQEHVTDEQYHRLDRLRNSGVEIVVTDSPVLLGKIYGAGKLSAEYGQKIMEYYNSFDNFNLVVKRGETYQTEGRLETFEQAKVIDNKIIDLLRSNNLFYGNYQHNEIAKTVDRINTTFNRLYGEKQMGEHKEKVDEKAGQPSNTLGEELAKKSTWLKIDLPDGAVGKEYGKTTLVKMPQGGEYSYFGIYVPTRFLKQLEGGKWQLTVGDKLSYRLNNDGRQVELTGKELASSFSGGQVGKQPVRVAPSKRNVESLARLEKNVPAEMKAIPNWCVYRTKVNEEKGKRDKFVLSPLDGKWAKSNEPQRWTDFDTAMKYAKENGCEGLSFVLDGKSGITCIDLDKCIGDEGKYNELASKLTSELKGTFTEKSVSGNGVHIFLKDDVLKNGKYKSTAITTGGDLEVYDTGHMISMTGDMISETNALGKCPTATADFLRRTLGEKPKFNSGSNYNARSSYQAGNDREVVARIQKSKKGAEFDALYSGKGLTGNASIDDMTLANMLAFFTDCDKEQCMRIMREASTYRPDKPDSYYQHTIQKAVDTLSTRPKFGTASAASANRSSGNGADGAAH